MRKGLFILTATVLSLSFVSCGKEKAESADIIGGADKPVTINISDKSAEKNEDGYISITMDEAEEIFKTPGDYIILDVRRDDEFAEGHIPNAVNIANEDITDTEPEGLPDKDQTIYVYCRRGNRSKEASKKLASMGYKNIIEFGGITDWKGEIAK